MLLKVFPYELSLMSTFLTASLVSLCNLDFVCYNVDVNLFSFVTLAFEFPNTGTAVDEIEDLSMQVHDAGVTCHRRSKNIMNEVREELGFRNALKLRINFCTGGVKGNVHIEVQGVVVKKVFLFLESLR